MCVRVFLSLCVCISIDPCVHTVVKMCDGLYVFVCVYSEPPFVVRKQMSSDCPGRCEDGDGQTLTSGSFDPPSVLRWEPGEMGSFHCPSHLG